MNASAFERAVRYKLSHEKKCDALRRARNEGDVCRVLGLVLGIIGVIPVVKEWIASPEKAHPAPVLPQPAPPVDDVKK